jgi:hypothetical protein
MWCLPPCLHPRIADLEDGVVNLNDRDDHLLTLDGRREFHERSIWSWTDYPALAGTNDLLQVRLNGAVILKLIAAQITAVLRYVDPCLDFWSVLSSDVCGGLKPWLRSGKPCGLDQPGAPRHREG